MIEVLAILLIGLVLVAFVYLIKGDNMGQDSKIQGYDEFTVIFDEFVESAEESKYLTEAERQFLQYALKTLITECETRRKDILAQAQAFNSLGDEDTASELFKAHRKAKKVMKKLTSIQTKVKHTLETRG